MRLLLKSGAALSYSPGGEGDVALVMLHPIGLRRDVWREAAALLASDCRTLALDLPGHGDSDIPLARITIESMAEAVGELVERVGGKRVVLAGCSMGSAVAATVAAQAPANVVGLITANSGHLRAPDRHQSLTRRAADARLGLAKIQIPTMQRWFSDEIMATRPDLVAEVLGWLLAGDPIVHGRCWEELRDFDYGPLFPRIAIPTLSVAGGADKSAGLASVKALAEGFAQGECQMVQGAGHLTPLERPHEYAGLVRGFLRRLG